MLCCTSVRAGIANFKFLVSGRGWPTTFLGFCKSSFSMLRPCTRLGPMTQTHTFFFFDYVSYIYTFEFLMICFCSCSCTKHIPSIHPDFPLTSHCLTPLQFFFTLTSHHHPQWPSTLLLISFHHFTVGLSSWGLAMWCFCPSVNDVMGYGRHMLHQPGWNEGWWGT